MTINYLQIGAKHHQHLFNAEKTWAPLHSSHKQGSRTEVRHPLASLNKETLFSPLTEFPFSHAYATAHQFGQFFKSNYPMFLYLSIWSADTRKSFREQRGVTLITSASSGNWDNLILQSLEQVVNMGTVSMYVLNPCMSKPATCEQEAALTPNPSLWQRIPVTHSLDMHMHDFSVGKRLCLSKVQVVSNSIRPNQQVWHPLKWKQFC